MVILVFFFHSLEPSIENGMCGTEIRREKRDEVLIPFSVVGFVRRFGKLLMVTVRKRAVQHMNLSNL